MPGRRCAAELLLPGDQPAVDSLEGAPGAFQCALRSTETSESATFLAPLAILANGSWEPLPAQRGQRRAQRRPSDLLAFKANFLGGALLPGVLPVLSFPGGYGGMVVADAGVMTLACCVRADRLERLRRASPGCSAGEVVEAMLRRECRGVDEALKTAVRAHPHAIGVAALFPVAVRRAAATGRFEAKDQR